LLNIRYGRTADIKLNTPFNPATYDSLQARLTQRMGEFPLAHRHVFESDHYADNSDSGLVGMAFEWERNRAQAGFNRPKNLQLYFVQPLPLATDTDCSAPGLCPS